MVPDLPVHIDHHDRANSERKQLLALHKLWRSVERGASRFPAADGATVAVDRRELAHALEELIAALDRRMPHLEREGEAAIVRDAAVLREKAVSRLSELAGEAPKKS